MKVSQEVEIITTLTLTHDEERWLSAWLQNPLPSEAPADRQRRQALFEALNPPRVKGVNE